MVNVGAGPTGQPPTDSIVQGGRPLDRADPAPLERYLDAARSRRSLLRPSRWRRAASPNRSRLQILACWVSLLVGSLALPGPLYQDFLTRNPLSGASVVTSPSPPDVVGSTVRGFSGSTGSSTTPLTASSGDAVIVLVAAHYLRTVTTVRDSSGNAYQPVGNLSTDSKTTLSVWLASDVPPSSALTVSVTLSKGAPTVLTVVVVGGVAADALDAVGIGATGASSAQATATVVTVSPNDLAFLAVASAGAPTISGTTSGLLFVNGAHETAGSVKETGATLSLATASAETFSLQAHLSTSEAWAALAFAVRPSVAPPPPGCLSMSSTFLVEFCQHIQHVVFIVMENHAYDNYFGTYCLILGSYCKETAHGIPTGTCEFEVGYSGTGYPAGSCPKGYINSWNYGPQNFTTINPQHNQESTVRSICGTTTSTSCLKNPPSMDGFWVAEGKQYTSFGEYNGSTIPIYWDIAQQYALGDQVFSSDPSYSLPNHWYMVAGQAPAQSQYYLLKTSEEHTYLNQANRTPTIQDLLNTTSSVTWKYYDWSLSNYKTAISGNVSLAYGNGSAYSYWNPMAARAESYTAWYSSHFVNRTPEFFDNLTQSPSPGEGLPNISWVIPDMNFSDHPPANVTYGEAFVANVLDAIEESRYWDSTAVFLTWDDYGGFYDHVGPPKLSGLNPLGLSIRVPFLVISPYTPQGLVSHQLGYFDSVLRLMEERWGTVGSTQDCQAPLPSTFFDFTNITSPRAPCLFPTNASEARYPSGCLAASSELRLDMTSWVGSDEGLNATDAD